MTVSLGARLGCAAATVALLVACAKAEPQSYLSEKDQEAPEGQTFDPNHIITLDELTDTTVTAELLRALITYRQNEKGQRKNPYGRDSFLATYYSNGLSSIDALVNASEQHRINPLVLLVRAQMDQGLMSLDAYPIDSPTRVEQVFRCGCAGPESCDPAFAGFDRQVDCLARQLRVILTDMETNGGVSAGGWGKGREGRSIDGRTVTPDDDGTAALYQYEPRVGDKKSGNRLFWQIWKLYTKASAYQGPTTTSAGGAWIGDPCTRSEQCKGIPGGVCISNYPGGMCTSKGCAAVDGCPTREGRGPAVCIDTGGGAYCFPKCTPGATSSCRGGSTEWACCAADVYPPAQSSDGRRVNQPVCLPAVPGSATGCAQAQ